MLLICPIIKCEQSQFWKSLPSADLAVELHFHGLTLDTGKSLTVVGGGEYLRLQVSSKVRFEQFSPSVSFGAFSSSTSSPFFVALMLIGMVQIVDERCSVLQRARSQLSVLAMSCLTESVSISYSTRTPSLFPKRRKSNLVSASVGICTIIRLLS